MSKIAQPIGSLVTPIVIVGLGLALFVGQAVASGGRVMTLIFWINLLAPAFFLAALWAASDALIRMDRGEAFGQAMVRGLKGIGGNLMIGAFAVIVVQPSLNFLIGNGFLEMRGVTFNLDVENLTLATVGLVLILLARHGQDLKSKLDQFV